MTRIIVVGTRKSPTDFIRYLDRIPEHPPRKTWGDILKSKCWRCAHISGVDVYCAKTELYLFFTGVNDSSYCGKINGETNFNWDVEGQNRLSCAYVPSAEFLEYQEWQRKTKVLMASQDKPFLFPIEGTEIKIYR